VAEVLLLQEACQELEQLQGSWDGLQSKRQQLQAQEEKLSQAQGNALAVQAVQDDRQQPASPSSMGELHGLQAQLHGLQEQVCGRLVWRWMHGMYLGGHAAVVQGDACVLQVDCLGITVGHMAGLPCLARTALLPCNTAATKTKTATTSELAVG
jgi:hypothetical protein